MKETRFFYVPDADSQTELPEEEARHALRVLRMGMGDELNLMDGKGTYYRAEITAATGHRCTYRILERMPQPRAWEGHLHLCMAPTKLMDRTEWMAEKVTEIGLDELTFLDTRFSGRRVVKCERVDKIVVAAMKQSHKAYKPIVNGMTPFDKFINRKIEGDKFICHCYETEDIGDETDKPLLSEVIRKGVDCTVLIGPEGDFSVDEVRQAVGQGFRSVSLGRSRLRTETAAIAAVHIMQMKNQIIL